MSQVPQRDVPRTVLDSLLLGFQVISPSFEYLYVNDIVALHGRTTREALLGRTMMECYPGIEQTEVFRVIERCLADRQPTSMVNAFTYPDGSQGWFELIFEPVPLGVTILSLDITRRRQAELALQRASRASETIARCSQVLVHAADEPTYVTGICEVLVEVGGLEAAWIELEPMPSEDDGVIVQGAGPWQTARTNPSAALALPLSRDTIRGVLWVLPADPADLEAGEHSLLAEVVDNVADGILILRDRVLRARHAQQLAHAQRLETIGRLAGGVAHDFNNLLCVIQAHAEFAELTLEAGHPALSEIAQVYQAVDRAQQLTRDLLAFGRQGPLAPRVTDVNAVVDALAPMLARLLSRDITLDIRKSTDPVRVMADVGKLEQVLLNLAVNARDAMEHGGGRLMIQTEPIVLAEEVADSYGAIPAGHYVRISVSDTGVGMRPEVRSRIFEPFYTTKEPGRGTGLGLASAHGFVKQSGGEIWVYSEPGVGTVFRLYLPAFEGDHPDTEVHGDDIAATGTERILVVDDDERVREAGRRMLEAAGFQVYVASDGASALARARELEGQLDLLLTDVVMPGQRGPELAAELQALYPRIAVVFISGYPDLGADEPGPYDQGVVFLSKPFTGPALTRVVREALDRAAADGDPTRD